MTNAENYVSQEFQPMIIVFYVRGMYIFLALDDFNMPIGVVVLFV